MPSSDTVSAPRAASAPRYRVFVQGRLRAGTARELIEAIWKDVAGRSDAVAAMGPAGYADALIKGGRERLDPRFLAYLEKEPYPSAHDRALRYLAETDAGGVRILSQSAADAD